MSASFFGDSQNLHIENGTFVTASNYNIHSDLLDASSIEDPNDYWQLTTPLDLLRRNIAGEAMLNSSERRDAPQVHPETRKAVQEEIFGWIKDGEVDPEPKKILWVSGPAGAGKTAIAGSIAELCEEEGLLAGSHFFSSFSRSRKRCLKQYVVATLAYCLLQHDRLQAVRENILSMIDRDPTIFGKTLSYQCKALLLRPFYNPLGRLDPSALPKVIILDGLDEVEADGSRQFDKHEARSANEADQVEILEMLLRAAQDPRFPFRIIVFSRPERVISEFFAVSAYHVSRKVFLDDKYDPDSDIALVLRERFAVIRRRYKMREGWPSEDQIRQLVTNASGQFIYAATVLRFLERGKRPDLQALLGTILEAALPHRPLDALAPLDTLYTRILKSSPNPPLALRWICIVDSGWFATQPPSAKFTRQLLQDFEDQEGHLLEDLASLVHVPSIGENDLGYKFYHKSMLDFLRSAHRCGQLFHESYNASMTFFYDRWYGVLKARTTMVPLTGSEQGEFLYNFWKHHPSVHRGITLSQRSDLSSCDIVGWIRMVCADCDSNHQAGIVGRIFRWIHCVNCHSTVSGDLTGCWEVCRRWRSAIIGECKRLGWVVPTQIVLLLERMFDEMHESWADSSLLISARHLRPPGSAPARSVVSPCSMMKDRQADLEKYEALLSDIQMVCQALPVDWVHCAKEMVTPKSSLGKALKAQLRRVRPEVRLRIGDLEAWLRHIDLEKVDENYGQAAAKAKKRGQKSRFNAMS